LTSAQKFNYLIASLRNEAKDLISNLQITHENFSVAWNLITQRYNNTRLIAMMHATQLVNLPQVRKGDASSHRKLTNHVTSNLNAFQALDVTVPIQDLMLNHLILSTIESETQKEWELITAPRADIPSTTELVTFLELRCQALELLQTTQSAEVQPTTSRAPRAPQSTRNKVSKL
jgi:diphosphomevalonate decarboxylase